MLSVQGVPRKSLHKNSFIVVRLALYTSVNLNSRAKRTATKRQVKNCSASICRNILCVNVMSNRSVKRV